MVSQRRQSLGPEAHWFWRLLFLDYFLFLRCYRVRSQVPAHTSFFNLGLHRLGFSKKRRPEFSEDTCSLATLGHIDYSVVYLSPHASRLY